MYQSMKPQKSGFQNYKEGLPDVASIIE